MRPLPLLWMPVSFAGGSDGFFTTDGGLLGRSGLAAGPLAATVGLGGGGLLGGAMLLFSLFSVMALPGGGAVAVGGAAVGGATGLLALGGGVGIRLLTLAGGGGLGPLGVPWASLLNGALGWAWSVLGAAAATGTVPEVLTGLLDEGACSETLPWPGTCLFGGDGRGILGGGGIMRLTGLFTFFILALALGGGMGVPVEGVFAVTLPPSSLTLGDGLAAAVPATTASSSKVGGRGGGGR